VAEPADETPYQSLYRRFRPATFGEVKGQDHVILALQNAVRDGRVAHAYLFSGPRGTGKTSTARILAKALNCTDLHGGEPCGVCSSCVEIARGASLDVHELDAASNNGVDAMRDLVSRAALGTPGRQKVYIVDEVHMLSTAASNALLKTLEEPPAHVVFVLATTDPQKVLPTIRSRTQHFEFRLLGPETLGALLDQVRRHAHLEVPDEALDLAVRRGRGSARDALSVLDQVAASQSVDDDLPELDEVVDALVERDVGRALTAVATLTSAGFSPQQITADLVDYLRQGFLALVAPGLVAVSVPERAALTDRAKGAGLGALVRALEVLGLAQVAMRDAPDPRVNLEVALVRLAHPEADDSSAALLARIERLETATPSTAVTPTAPPPPVPAVATASVAGLASVADPGTQHRRTVGAVRRQAGPPSGESVPPREPGPLEAERTGPPTSATAVPFPSRDQLVQVWGDHIVGRLRPKAKALFQAGRFVAVKDERALFGLPNEIHRLRCEEVRPEIESVLSERFGRPVPLELVLDADLGAGSAGASSLVGDVDPVEPAEPGLPADPAPSAAEVARSLITPPPPTHPPSTVMGAVDEPDDVDEFSAFDEDQLGEVADVDNSARARLLQAFPGAEEVS